MNIFPIITIALRANEFYRYKQDVSENREELGFSSYYNKKIKELMLTGFNATIL